MGMVREYSVTQTNVGAVLTETSLVVPIRGRILRCRVLVTAGTAINTVQFQFRTVTAAPSTLDIDLAYSLTANPIDAEESIDYFLAAASTSTYYGTAFIATAVDNAVADHTITTQLTIESPAMPDGYGQGAL